MPEVMPCKHMGRRGHARGRMVHRTCDHSSQQMKDEQLDYKLEEAGV